MQTQQCSGSVCTGRHKDLLGSEGIIETPEELSQIALRQFGVLVKDFLDAPPETFEVPPLLGGSRLYKRRHSSRKMDNLKTFRSEMDKLFKQATQSTAFCLLSARWPQYHQEFRTQGYQGDFPRQVVAILPQDHPDRLDYQAKDLTQIAIHTIREAFAYGEFGVYILAVPVDWLKDYFTFHNELIPNCRLRRGVWIPPQFIVDFHGRPSKSSKILLEKILEKYSLRLKQDGFRVERERSGPGVESGRIPAIMRKGELEVGLDGNWDARGILEAIHRIFIINKIIEAYKMEYNPC